MDHRLFNFIETKESEAPSRSKITGKTTFHVAVAQNKERVIAILNLLCEVLTTETFTNYKELFLLDKILHILESMEIEPQNLVKVS